MFESNKLLNIFITLNPLSDQYKGRVVLPNTLRNVFRPVAMLKPDILNIIKVKLEVLGMDAKVSPNVS